MLTETERDCLDRYCRLLAAPEDERTRTFLEQVRADGVDVWSSR